MTTITDDYYPYHTMTEFGRGVADYLAGKYGNPYYPLNSLKAEAFESGAEYAAQLIRGQR